MKHLIIFLIACASMVFSSCSTMPKIEVPTYNQNAASKGYVDSAVNPLKFQISQYKKTIDSLNNIVKKNTVLIDTSSGSDFNIQKGVLNFNRPNLSRMIKAIVIQIKPNTKTVAKKKK